MIIVTPSFPKRFCLQHVSPPHEKENLACSNSPGLKSVIEKPRFRDGPAD